MFEQLIGIGPFSGGFMAFIIIISIWGLIWKGIALWKCGRNDQLAWFVIILIFNTAGILPIVYLLFGQKKPVISIVTKRVVKKPAKKKKSVRKKTTKRKVAKKKSKRRVKKKNARKKVAKRKPARKKKR